LHYQNITWPERKISTTILDDFANTRATFDINQKISSVVSQYLQADNNS
jgi:hypothetical protein